MQSCGPQYERVAVIPPRDSRDDGLPMKYEYRPQSEPLFYLSRLTLTIRRNWYLKVKPSPSRLLRTFKVSGVFVKIVYDFNSLLIILIKI